MVSKSGTKKIIWAIDAFFSSTNLEKRALQIINAWNADSDLDVEPVFVLNDITEKKSWAHNSAQTNLNEILKSVDVENLRPTKIIRTVKPPFTNRKLVNGLVKFSDNQNTELLVVHSSNKNVGARISFGSFAETLILTSTKPILLISSKAKKTTSIKSILFATDFSKESLAAYRSVLKKAKRLSAKVILFHQFEPTYLPSKLGGKKYIKNLKSIHEWEKLAEKENVKISVRTKKGLINKANAILDNAKTLKVDLIALVAKSGPMGSLLLGSTTHQVARESATPVWILQPKRKTK